MCRVGPILLLMIAVVTSCSGEEPSFHARPAPSAPVTATEAEAPVAEEAPLPVLGAPLSAETTACHERAAAVLASDPSRGLAVLADLECACRGGEPTSCAAVGALLRAEGEAPDPSRSLAAYRRACDLGDSFGCTNLGTTLSREHADPAGALEAYLRACDLGDAVGCANAGASIGLGRAGPPDIERSRELFRLACERGDAPSCAHLTTIGH